MTSNYLELGKRLKPECRFIGDSDRWLVITSDGRIAYFARTESQAKNIALGASGSTIVDLEPPKQPTPIIDTCRDTDERR